MPRAITASAVSQHIKKLEDFYGRQLFIRRNNQLLLTDSARTVLATSFGGKNPQGVFQYVRVEGRGELYLLPVFVGREWELVAAGMTGS